MAPILLKGAFDESIGTPEARNGPVQVMHLELSNDILNELLECVRKNKAPQVLFGKVPLIKYDGKSHELHTKPEKFRHEIYGENEENEWEFGGFINHSLALRDAEVAEAGMDRALETLQNNMAVLQQEREARKAAVTPEVRATKGMSKAQSRATLLKPLLGNNGRSSPGSPALGSSTPSQLKPPTSAGLDMPYDIAIRKALIHYLAVQPRSFQSCRFIIHTNPRRILERVARQTTKGEDEWTLQDRTYKELDVYKFKYSEEDRQLSIENAIKAYDRIRVSKDDPLWQKLLPQEERGKGKILSRLHLKELKDPTTKGTPVVKAQGFDKKTGMPKRKEPKKADKEGVKAKKAKANDHDEKSKAMKSAAESQTPKAEPRKVRQPVRREPRPENGGTPVAKPVKPSAAAKSLLNKPKNLSPLGASPPVNASDFDHGHPIHKALAAATSPRQGMKRKADNIIHKTNGVTKRPHIDSASSSSEDRPLKAKNSATNGNVMTNGHRSNGHVSPDSDSSESNQPLALSWRQSLEMARKFNQYYLRYKKLYTELSQSSEPPSEKKREELLEMHRRLEKMKREVNNGQLI